MIWDHEEDVEIGSHCPGIGFAWLGQAQTSSPAYARMNGIVPPWTEEQQQRQRQQQPPKSPQ